MKPLRLALLMIPVALAGCSATVKPAEPVTTIKEVPVPVPCVKDVPVAPLLTHDALGRATPIDILYSAALTDKDKLRLYADQLLIQVKACAVIPR